MVKRSNEFVQTHTDKYVVLWISTPDYICNTSAGTKDSSVEKCVKFFIINIKRGKVFGIVPYNKSVGYDFQETYDSNLHIYTHTNT